MVTTLCLHSSVNDSYTKQHPVLSQITLFTSLFVVFSFASGLYTYNHLRKTKITQTQHSVNPILMA